jgi:suppressor for copper-sensitivity B
MTPLFFRSALLAALSCVAIQPSYAQPAPPADVVKPQLVAAGVEGDTLLAALDVNLAEGWHTYWRTPGESGLAPVFDWGASENLGAVEILYPAPMRDSEFDIHTFVYGNHVAFPLKVTAADPAKPVTLKGKATFMVCNQICVPEVDELNITLDPKAPPDAEAVKAYQEALAHVPQAEKAGDYAISGGVLSEPAFTVTVMGVKPGDKIETFVEQKEGYFLRPPEVTTTPEGATLLTFKGPTDTKLVEKLSGQTVNVTVIVNDTGLTRSFTF